MALGPGSDRLLEVLRDTIIGMVRREGPDLTARQLGVLLICYLEERPHTVRELAARLDVSKPAITRAIDRLMELGFARRGPDPRDRRSVLVQRTRRGSDVIADLRQLLSIAEKAQ
jgi:DNA-binding MarR family transcriptional regulator